MSHSRSRQRLAPFAVAGGLLLAGAGASTAQAFDFDASLKLQCPAAPESTASAYRPTLHLTGSVTLEVPLNQAQRFWKFDNVKASVQLAGGVSNPVVLPDPRDQASGTISKLGLVVESGGGYSGAVVDHDATALNVGSFGPVAFSDASPSLAGAFGPAPISTTDGSASIAFSTPLVDAPPFTTPVYSAPSLRVKDLAFTFTAVHAADPGRDPYTSPLFDCVEAPGQPPIYASGGNYMTPPAPTITSISPATAPYRSAAPVTIRGAGFLSTRVHSIAFGYINTTAFKVVDDTTITLNAPLAFGRSQFDVILNSDFGQSANTPADDFLYTTDNPGPSTPGTPVVSDVAGDGSGATLSWSPSTDASGYVTYRVFDAASGAQLAQTALGVSSATVSGLAPGSHSVYVIAYDIDGTPSAQSGAASWIATIPSTTPVITTPEASTPALTTPVVTTPAPPRPYTFLVSGSATLKTLVRGALPLAGGAVAQVDAGGAFTASLDLGQTTANLKALGILPVTATVQFVSTAPVTGTLTGTSLSATAKVRIKLPSFKVLGVPLAGGANCQAAQLSSIALKSTSAFSLAGGGTLGGTFSISNLTGCGSLTNLVSSITSGSSNALALSLKASAPAGA